MSLSTMRSPACYIAFFKIAETVEIRDERQCKAVGRSLRASCDGAWKAAELRYRFAGMPKNMEMLAPMLGTMSRPKHLPAPYALHENADAALRTGWAKVGPMLARVAAAVVGAAAAHEYQGLNFHGFHDPARHEPTTSRMSDDGVKREGWCDS